LRAGDRGTDGSEGETKKLKAGDRDPEFLQRVNQCVGKGVEFLLKRQQPDGNFEKSTGSLNNVPYAKGFPGGVSALVLLALLRSGVNRHDEKIKKGFDWLKQNQVTGERFNPSGWGTNYVAAATIMALEARYEPPRTIRKPEDLTSARPAVRVKMKRDDFLWMRRLVRFIEVGIVKSSQETFLQGTTGKVISGPDSWNYPGNVPDGGPRSGTITSTNRWPDHSNTQYALLGLKAAERCGLNFDGATYKAMANVVLHFVKFQQAKDPSRKKVPRMTMLEDKEHGYVSYKSVTRALDEPRGWKYMGAANEKMAGNPWQKEVTGSMTTAGVACLLISSSFAKRKGFLMPRLLADAKQAVWDGIAWLNVNFTVSKNPGPLGRRWLYYYLYGMERAAVLAGIRNIGEHDWYREGAEFLMSRQGANGAWNGDAVPTCFALLFLTRATIPMGGVITR
jgi:hypothetical protein